MSEKLRPSQFADAKGIIVETFDPNVGGFAEGPTVPADTTAGYSPGCLFLKRAGTAGAQLYINEGTKLSSLFKPFPSQASAVGSPVNGVAAGYKIARGQHTQVAASDTIVTGLATVVSVVASIETDVDGDTLAQVTAQIGDQAGSPAAGSIVVKTWKVTTGGAAGNPTLIAATTFGQLINWIAVGT